MAWLRLFRFRWRIGHDLDLLVLVEDRHSQAREFKLDGPRAVSLESLAWMHDALMVAIDPRPESFHEHSYRPTSIVMV
jgi:hypothetical protein